MLHHEDSQGYSFAREQDRDDVGSCGSCKRRSVQESRSAHVLREQGGTEWVDTDLDAIGKGTCKVRACYNCGVVGYFSGECDQPKGIGKGGHKGQRKGQKGEGKATYFGRGGVKGGDRPPWPGSHRIFRPFSLYLHAILPNTSPVLNTRYHPRWRTTAYRSVTLTFKAIFCF